MNASQKIVRLVIVKNTLSKILFVFLTLTSLLNLFSNAPVLLYAYAFLLFVFLILTSLLNLFSNARVLLYAYASQKIVRLVIIKNT